MLAMVINQSGMEGSKKPIKSGGGKLTTFTRGKFALYPEINVGKTCKKLRSM